MKNLNLTIAFELLNQKDNAGRLLLIVTRGVYFDKLIILVHSNKRSKGAKQNCNAKILFKNKKIEFCASDSGRT
jgi:hypothetical protein